MELVQAHQFYLLSMHPHPQCLGLVRTGECAGGYCLGNRKERRRATTGMPGGARSRLLPNNRASPQHDSFPVLEYLDALYL